MPATKNHQSRWNHRNYPPPWRCIPCGATSNPGPFCAICGRAREDATDEARWAKFFGADAVIAAIPCDDCHRTDGTHDLEVEH